MSRLSERSGRRATWLAAGAGLTLALSAGIVLGSRTAAPRTATPFGWLRPAPVPPGWAVARTPSGATLAAPPSWRWTRADPGAVSAAPASRLGAFAGYLNATPLQGGETLANWHRFRLDHIAGEGAHRVRLYAAASGLRFRSARASCVIDSYRTSRDSFGEIACIVAGSRATTVVVGAAPIRTWARQAPTIERAIASFST